MKDNPSLIRATAQGKTKECNCKIPGGCARCNNKLLSDKNNIKKSVHCTRKGALDLMPTPYRQVFSLHKKRSIRFDAYILQAGVVR